MYNDIEFCGRNIEHHPIDYSASPYNEMHCGTWSCSDDYLIGYAPILICYDCYPDLTLFIGKPTKSSKLYSPFLNIIYHNWNTILHEICNLVYYKMCIASNGHCDIPMDNNYEYYTKYLYQNMQINSISISGYSKECMHITISFEPPAYYDKLFYIDIRASEDSHKPYTIEFIEHFDFDGIGDCDWDDDEYIE